MLPLHSYNNCETKFEQKQIRLNTLHCNNCSSFENIYIITQTVYPLLWQSTAQEMQAVFIHTATKECKTDNKGKLKQQRNGKLKQ